MLFSISSLPTPLGCVHSRPLLLEYPQRPHVAQPSGWLRAEFQRTVESALAIIFLPHTKVHGVRSSRCQPILCPLSLHLGVLVLVFETGPYPGPGCLGLTGSHPSSSACWVLLPSCQHYTYLSPTARFSYLVPTPPC